MKIFGKSTNRLTEANLSSGEIEKMVAKLDAERDALDAEMEDKMQKERDATRKAVAPKDSEQKKLTLDSFKVAKEGTEDDYNKICDKIQKLQVEIGKEIDKGRMNVAKIESEYIKKIDKNRDEWQKTVKNGLASIRLQEAVDRDAFPKFELTEPKLRDYAKHIFGKNYFDYDDKMIVKSDLDMLLRGQKIYVNGVPVSATMSGMEKMVKILKKWGWGVIKEKY